MIGGGIITASTMAGVGDVIIPTITEDTGTDTTTAIMPDIMLDITTTIMITIPPIFTDIEILSDPLTEEQVPETFSEIMMMIHRVL